MIPDQEEAPEDWKSSRSMACNDVFGVPSASKKRARSASDLFSDLLHSPTQDPNISSDSTTVAFGEYDKVWRAAGVCMQRATNKHRQEEAATHITNYVRRLEAENSRLRRDVENLESRLLLVEQALSHFVQFRLT